MTDDPERPLRTMILDLMVEVKGLAVAVRAMQRRQDEIVAAMNPEFERLPTPEDVEDMLRGFGNKPTDL